jgi:hypothetical protein
MEIQSSDSKDVSVFLQIQNMVSLTLCQILEENLHFFLFGYNVRYLCLINDLSISKIVRDIIKKGNNDGHSGTHF